MKGTTAYALVWFATAIAVSVGIYVTKNPDCLWAFLIPACVSFTSSN